MVFGNYADNAEIAGATSSTCMTDSKKFDEMIDKFVDENLAEDIAMFEHKLRNDLPILLSEEHIVRMFRTGRDRVIYTNKRYLFVDVKGWSGKKIRYVSVPLEWLAAFSVETAGHLDNDAELYLHTCCALETLAVKFLVKELDIMEMHEHLTNYLLVYSWVLNPLKVHNFFNIK
jgi:Bacterial PH domain